MPQTPVAQGNLNRLAAKVQYTDPAFVTLNVLSGNLGPAGIRLAFDDVATDLLPTMTGMVTSPKPYQGVTLTMALVKSAANNLADSYMQQFYAATLLGAVTVIPDAQNLSPFPLLNMTLETVRELNFAGVDPVLEITLRGYRLVNQGFFQ
jgi:hypothetical protein